MDIVLLITASGAFLFGVLIGFLNSKISKKVAAANDLFMAMGVNVIRLIIDIACLVTVFAVCRIMGTIISVPLITAAVGLTAGGMFFLWKVTLELDKGRQETAGRRETMTADAQKEENETGWRS